MMTRGEDDAPPAALEERVVRTLRDQGILAPPRPRRAGPRWARHAWRAAAGGALAASFLLGAASGARRERARAAAAEAAPAAGTGTARFALLLYRDPADARAPGVTHVTLAAEYGAWARALSARGHAVSGEALDARAWTVDAAAAADGVAAGAAAPRLVGFFVLSARDADEARALARSCPHVRRGGTVVVRPISPT